MSTGVSLALEQGKCYVKEQIYIQDPSSLRSREGWCGEEKTKLTRVSKSRMLTQRSRSLSFLFHPPAFHPPSLRNITEFKHREPI